MRAHHIQNFGTIAKPVTDFVKLSPIVPGSNEFRSDLGAACTRYTDECNIDFETCFEPNLLLRFFPQSFRKTIRGLPDGKILCAVESFVWRDSNSDFSRKVLAIWKSTQGLRRKGERKENSPIP